MARRVLPPWTKAQLLTARATTNEILENSEDCFWGKCHRANRDGRAVYDRIHCAGHGTRRGAFANVASLHVAVAGFPIREHEISAVSHFDDTKETISYGQ